MTRTQSMQLSTAQRQRQILSQQTIQSIEILEMDCIDLQAFIEAKSLDNPLIEPNPRPAALQVDLRNTERTASSSRSPISCRLSGSDEQRLEMYERLTWQSHQGRATLREHLHESLSSLSLDATEREMARYMIDCLDNRGFLCETDDQIARDYGARVALVTAVRQKLRTLEPRGAFSASLRECLVSQIDAAQPLAELATAIIDTSLEDFLKSKLGKIARALGVSVEEVRAAGRIIASLNPYPSNYFDGGDPVRYVTPDVIVRHERDQWVVELNEAAAPSVRMNDDYAALAAHVADAGTAAYFTEKKAEFEQIRYCINRRSSTLLTVARVIVSKQSGFFEEGPDHLAPLTLAEVARDLSVTESTISRCVKGKYLACPYGVLSLSSFFARKAPSSTEASTTQVIKRVEDLIRAEDKSAPLSDQAIAQKLAAEGLALSRRTVAKYRQNLGIPNTCGRMRRSSASACVPPLP